MVVEYIAITIPKKRLIVGTVPVLPDAPVELALGSKRKPETKLASSRNVGEEPRVSTPTSLPVRARSGGGVVAPALADESDGALADRVGRVARLSLAPRVQAILTIRRL